MAEISAKVIAHFMNLINEAQTRSIAQFRANLVVEVATLRLLIDKGTVTLDEAVRQIEATRAMFPGVFGRGDVAEGVSAAISILRGEEYPHGSMIDQHIQAREREQRKAD